MATKILGYNIAFKLNSKQCIGVTQEDLSINAITKDSITKDDNGNTTTIVTGHEVAFTIAGVVSKAESGDTAKLDADELLKMALKKGAEAEIPFVYSRGSLASYNGKFIITSYSESSPADDTASYSLSCKLVGGELNEVIAS